jgi:TRAP-type C4-dicarboxylate transport system permease small subunit
VKVWACVFLLSGWPAWIAGSILLYSDLSGQRPIHDQAAIGLMLMSLPVFFVLVILVVLLDYARAAPAALPSSAGSVGGLGVRE